MEIWPLIQQNAISVLSAIVAAVGVYFGARSYYLSERKKQDEEISRIKQLLVGSSEVSVQNLTDVIESLRSRVDRLEEDRARIQDHLDEERERVSNLEEEKSKLLDDVGEARNVTNRMEKKIRRLCKELESAREEIETLRNGQAAPLSVSEGVDWSPPPFRQEAT